MEVNVKILLNLSNKLDNIIEGFDEVFFARVNTLTIKDRILIYLSEKSLSPIELIKNLGIAKSNLALIMKSLIKENLVIKFKDNFDKRNICYKLTDNGLANATKLLNKINENINKQLNFKQNADKINELATKLNELLG